MKKFFLAVVAVGVTMTSGSFAMANHHGTDAKSPEIVERNARGVATKVKIEGKVYAVCMDGMTDGCINPRAAGLKWGNRPLDYWPGKPASQMD
ncbi:hypothetical protein [Pontixanthobacter luteolus]|uniref:hypothetical protein n=1 Tax=Pontixanthobacter luteolus TaxID=295089 RepID=UPI00230362DD|nr:hypothetical protein [Pontixanthobacter luteolus]